MTQTRAKLAQAGVAGPSCRALGHRHAGGSRALGRAGVRGSLFHHARAALIRLTETLVAASMLAAGLLAPDASAQSRRDRGDHRFLASERRHGPSRRLVAADVRRRIAPSRYTLVRDGERTVLRAEAQASASGLDLRARTAGFAGAGGCGGAGRRVDLPESGNTAQTRHRRRDGADLRHVPRPPERLPRRSGRWMQC